MMQSLLFLVGGLIAYLVLDAVYNVFFHPLRNFPGPLLYRASRIPYTVCIFRQHLHLRIEAMHLKYGNVVRVAPNELAFADPRAIRDIMSGGANDLPKWAHMHQNPAFAPEHIQNIVNKDKHRVVRKALSPGFSETSLRAQEGLISGYVDKLVKRLHTGASQGPANLEALLLYTTFDIMGDLSMGESFGCLDNSGFHQWIKVFLDSETLMMVLIAINMYPVIRTPLNFLMKVLSAKHIAEHYGFAGNVIRKRMALDKNRPDLINPLLEKYHEKQLSFDDLTSTSGALIGAGSGTTSGAMCGTLFYLLKNRDQYQKVKDEVRSAFTSQKQINFISVKGLPYLSACIDESMRLYSTSHVGAFRIVPTGGHTIAGSYVPANTVVGTWPWSMSHRPDYWTDASEFHPERWLGDPKFENDVRDAFKPFSAGTRNCIGQNLAQFEMHYIIAKLIYNFDMKLESDSMDWVAQQKSRVLTWQRGPLNVSVTPIVAMP